MYDDSEVCVRINGVKSDWFSINSGVRQGCVMSPWLFNLYMDGVMKELKVGVTGNGVRMMEMSGGCPTYYMLSLIHISEPTRLLSISYAVFCLKKKKKIKQK